MIITKELPKPSDVVKRNKTYLESSDDYYGWFDENFNKTDDKKDIIKLKTSMNCLKIAITIYILLKEINGN